MTGFNSRYKIAIVAPTCFYYQVDLFRQLAAHPRIDLNVYFCSKEALDNREIRAMYSTGGSWGIEDTLLEGYQSKFLRNYSPWNSYLKSFYGLVNLGIIKELFRLRPHAIILMSWMNPTWWFAIWASFILRIPIFYMTDANVHSERSGRLLKKVIKGFSLGKILFRYTSGFLSAGTANEQMYRQYGVPDSKIFPFAYSWGYDKLIEQAGRLKPDKHRLRAELGISEQETVILYCGRFSPEKALPLLLQAYHRLRLPNTVLILAGDGPMRESIEKYILDHQLNTVRILGFLDRSAIGKYYAAADVFILPSHRDTWGIVVAEAMCFGLPIIVSDSVGSGVDLVTSGQNGYLFPAGDLDALTSAMKRILLLTKGERALFGAQSSAIIQNWIGRNVADSLDRYLDAVYERKTSKKIYGRNKA